MEMPEILDKELSQHLPKSTKWMEHLPKPDNRTNSSKTRELLQWEKCMFNCKWLASQGTGPPDNLYIPNWGKLNSQSDLLYWQKLH